MAPPLRQPLRGFCRTLVQLGAQVHPTARLAANVVVGAGASIGPECELQPGVVVGQGVHIEERTVVGPNASIENGRVGAGCVIHAGVRIGADGFGFDIDTNGVVQKKPQLLQVLIGDNVEIGANTCIDRGSWRDTTIGTRHRLRSEGVARPASPRRGRLASEYL